MTDAPPEHATTERPLGGDGRRRWTAVGVAAGLALAGVAVADAWRADDPPPGNSAVAAPAPAFDLENLNPSGARVRLADLAGRPVLVNFWATWCVPCRTELPAFQAEHDRLGDRVAFVGINHLDGRSYARDLFADLGVTYPSGFDPDGTVADRFGLYGMPTTVLIDTNGRVVATHTGELSQSDLAELVHTYFGIPNGSP